jgi:hypothetical protein
MKRWASLAVLLLYPGFFFYHAAVGLAGVTPSLGGYYGVVSVLLLAGLVPLVGPSVLIGRFALNRMDLGFLALCSLSGVWALVLHQFGAPYQREGELLVQAITMLGLWAVNYFAFRHLDIGSRPLRIGLAISAFLIISIALRNQVDGQFQPVDTAVATAEGLVATYQGFARSAFVVFLLLLVVLRAAWLIWAIGAGLGTLLVLGARSEFVGFMVASAAVSLLRSREFRLRHLLMPALLLGVAGLWRLPRQITTNARIGRLLDLGVDGSYLTRVELTRNAVRTVQEYPLFGDYGSYLMVGGNGGYAHNALSAWVDYGFAGFLLFVSLLVGALWIGVGELRRAEPRDVRAVMAIGFAVHLLLMAAVAKSVMYPLFAAGWGAAAGLVGARRLEAGTPMRGEVRRP